MTAAHQVASPLGRAPALQPSPEPNLVFPKESHKSDFNVKYPNFQILTMNSYAFKTPCEEEEMSVTDAYGREESKQNNNPGTYQRP